MAVFQFRGIAAASGKEVRGVRDADNPKGLRVALRKEGIVLTAATEARDAQEKKSRDIQFLAFLKRPSTSDVAVVTKQLATLIKAGIPLNDAIGALTDQVEKEELKRVLSNVREMVNEGTAFADALSHHPDVFPSLFVNMVAAGEASGSLKTVLERLATFMDSQAKLKGKVLAAMAYPILMLCIGSILITVLMIGVVPKVTAIFASLDKALPWYTVVLIAVSSIFSSPIAHGLVCGGLLGSGSYVLLSNPAEPIKQTMAGSVDTHRGKDKGKKKGGAIASVVIASVVLLAEVSMRESATRFLLALIAGLLMGAAVGSFFAWLRTAAGRYARDRFLLGAPILGSLLQMISVARFLSTLASLLASGVQLLRAMEIVRAVIGNAVLEKVVEDATESIREGESIAEPLKRSKRFPPIVTHMIAVGEKSGQLEQMLEAVATSYESSIEIKITTMTSLLEPLMIILMGGAVGFIAFAILMPLIQMNEFNQ